MTLCSEAIFWKMTHGPGAGKLLNYHCTPFGPTKQLAGNSSAELWRHNISLVRSLFLMQAHAKKMSRIVEDVG
jgi:hypothetical protein